VCVCVCVRSEVSVHAIFISMKVAVETNMGYQYLSQNLKLKF
jgi:hypothetical protein